MRPVLDGPIPLMRSKPLFSSLSFALAFVVVGVGLAWAQGEPIEIDASWNEKLASSLQGSIASGQVWIALLAVWVGGLLTSFTPCVWPLIPITVRYFGAMKDSTRGQVFRRALVYVAGLMILYSALGVTIAARGQRHGSVLSSPKSFFVRT